MENKIENTNLTGYSHRAQSLEFREEVKDKQKKNTKRNLIITLVFLALFILACLMIFMSPDLPDTEVVAWMDVIALAVIPICGMLALIMGIVTLVSHIRNSKGLQTDSWDGVVLEKKTLGIDHNR